jgi:hypothetical protein
MTFTETRIPGVWLIDHERDASYPGFMVGHEQR